MLCKRIIARLDIKGPNLVKGVHMEGLRIIGDPYEFAKHYEEQGADELLYIDTVASLYGRSNLVETVRKTTMNIFIPITVGGGIRTIEDIRVLLNAGADKVAINTAAIKNPEFISQAVDCFGSQCIVISIEAKRRDDHWEAYAENGREPTGKDAIAWIGEAIAMGAGEILLTSIDADGTRKGFDMELISAAAKVCTVPLIVCGGAGSLDDFERVFKYDIDAVATGSALHYNMLSISDIKKKICEKVNIRP